jgi:hypothetical protein
VTITGLMESGTDANGMVWAKKDQYTLQLWPNGTVTWRKPE